jgi:hypothetical protein
MLTIRRRIRQFAFLGVVVALGALYASAALALISR